MVALPNIGKRLQLLGIDSKTTNIIHGFYPTLNMEIDNAISRFYAHLLTQPEGRAMFGDRRAVAALKPRQREHWMSLFSCTFDEAYVESAIKVGRIHYERKIAPYLYMAGYNFFHAELNGVAWRHCQDRGMLRDLLEAISRLVTLDMELALSAYTRQRWLKGAEVELVANAAPY